MVHVPGDLLSDDHRRFRGVGIEAQSRQDVGEVDARRTHADPHFAGGCGRIARFADL